MLPKRKTKSEYWYHVSGRNHGKKVTLIPKSVDYHTGNGEPNYPRVCVAPSVAECLAAIRHGINGCLSLHVYRTEIKVKAYYPKQQFISSRNADEKYWYYLENLKRVGGKLYAFVEDAHITNERWILTPTTFVLMSTITKKQCSAIDDMIPPFSPGDSKYFGEQTQAIKMLKERFKEYA